MFLAIDECFGTENSQYTTLGCLCLPQSKFLDYEKKFTQNRVDHMVWGEIKWSSITQTYLRKYKEIISDYLSNDDVTFHSWTYKNPTPQEVREHYRVDNRNRVVYVQAYIMIRFVIWKCRNAGYKGDYYILADESSFGSEEYQTTRRLLAGDSRIRPSPDIKFCNVGNSVSCGALQVADMCTGAACSYYDPALIGGAPQSNMVTHLERLNGGIKLNATQRGFPSLSSNKLHHALETR